ncbi:MAG: PH domain-containing protein [Halorhodospira sp.]
MSRESAREPLMPQPGPDTETWEAEERGNEAGAESLRGGDHPSTEPTRGAGAAAASDPPAGESGLPPGSGTASSMDQQAPDADVAGQRGAEGGMGSASSEADADRLPSATVLDRPEGRTQRLRVAYRSLWRWWLLGGLGASFVVRPSWPLEVAAGDLPQVQETLGPEGYALIVSGLSWGGLGMLALAVVVIAYERLASRYLLYPGQVAEERGLIARRVSRVDLRHVRTVDIDQSIVQRLLGVGTIQFASAGTSSTDVEWSGVVQPIRVQHQVLAKMRELEDSPGESA